ncbi:hypothetical protein DIPPA_12776 [Diplonema papillatum]|nr:hypothetical protein DIPPA_12776 [Diplonema papillatum]
MDVGDGTANPRPTEGIVSIGLRPHVRQALFCSLHYQWREGRAETVYVGSFTVPRAEHDPPCEGRAAVRVHNSTLTARISLADGTDMFWTQSID